VIILSQRNVGFTDSMREGRKLRHSEPQQALKMFNQAAELSPCPTCTVSAMMEIGITYRQLKLYREAEEYLTGAEKLLQPQESDLMALVKMEIGKIFLEARCSQDKAYSYLLESKGIFEKLDYKMHTAITQCLVGQVQHFMKFDPLGSFTIRRSYHTIKGRNDNEELKILLWYMRTSTRARFKYLPHAIKLSLNTKNNCFRPLVVTTFGHKVEKKIFKNYEKAPS